MNKGKRYLIFDESGNLGRKGKYFVISCIDTYNKKSLHNIMKKKVGKAKSLFPEQIPDIEINKFGIKGVREIKCCWAYPCVKYHLLESISSKDLKISYIVADLQHVKPELLEDQNLLYNYLLKILIDSIIEDNFKNQELKIIIDNTTVKVGSTNSFTEYIKIHLNYERCLNLDIEVKYIDSNSREGYVVQAADFVANTIYSSYEFGNNTQYVELIHRKFDKIQKFPRSLFGKENKKSKVEPLKSV